MNPKWFCYVLGHVWKDILPGTRKSVLVVCQRCETTGWRLL